MKLKSLLYGSAAAVLAATGAQAADIPVAEPVNHVRICDAFGNGFFYIPGTDNCLKIGGYVRVEARFQERDVATRNQGGRWDASNARGDARNSWSSFARGSLQIDNRVATDIGLVRAFFEIQVSRGSDFDASDGLGNGIGTGNIFLQVSNDSGTTTIGFTSSQFDFFGSQTIEGGLSPTTEQTQLAYTFNIGNGLSATLSLEDGHSSGRFTGLAEIVDDNLTDVEYGGTDWPDVIANFRADQAWGSAQIMGVYHQVPVDGGVQSTTSGWAVGAGASFDASLFRIAFQGGYADGAPGYVTSPDGNLYDAIYDSVGGSIEKTKAWQIQGGVVFDISSNWQLRADVGYADIDQFSTYYDYNEIAVAGDIRWTPVSGLLLALSAEWNDISDHPGCTDALPGIESTCGSLWKGRFRAQKSF